MTYRNTHGHCNYQTECALSTLMFIKSFTLLLLTPKDTIQSTNARIMLLIHKSQCNNTTWVMAAHGKSFTVQEGQLVLFMEQTSGLTADLSSLKCPLFCYVVIISPHVTAISVLVSWCYTTVGDNHKLLQCYSRR